MNNNEMRRVILATTRGEDPDKCDEHTGACHCGEEGCPHCYAVRWNTAIHSFSNYNPLHKLQYELKALGREDLANLMSDAFIGLSTGGIKTLGDLVLKGVLADMRKRGKGK
jgi:hypothetical protein